MLVVVAAAPEMPPLGGAQDDLVQAPLRPAPVRVVAGAGHGGLAQRAAPPPERRVAPHVERGRVLPAAPASGYRHGQPGASRSCTAARVAASSAAPGTGGSPACRCWPIHPRTAARAAPAVTLVAGYLSAVLISAVPWLHDHLTADQQQNLPIVIAFILSGVAA